ncbi:MAG: DNA repair protein RecO [Lachnospiraceae bacterium]|nr:DNA repair protein RecO [Lachnospiraceae bacterium]
MQDFVSITGMILKSAPVGEYDRRVVILTKERGKITAFVKGARRQNSRFMASTDIFCFGEYKLYPGRDAYNVSDAVVRNYFEELRKDFEGAYYGMYFLEIADYYARENTDEREMLKLLYQSLRALGAKSLDNRLVRYIFECKTIVVNGEFPGIRKEEQYSEGLQYTISYIVNTQIERLYTFRVSEEILGELQQFAQKLRRQFLNAPFKSLEILESLVEKQ